MVWKRIQAERQRGRDYQPRFQQRHVIGAWLGALLAITALGLISLWSQYPLVVAPFGASTVLLFGHPSSPWRNRGMWCSATAWPPWSASAASRPSAMAPG